MNSLRMKIAALASVAGLGALGGYALNSNTGVSTQTQAALTQKPKPKVKTQVMHRTVHVKPKNKNAAAAASGPPGGAGFDSASGARRSALPGTGADASPGRVGIERRLFERRDVPAGRDAHERLQRRSRWQRFRSPLTPAVPAVAVARASTKVEARAVTDTTPCSTGRKPLPDGTGDRHDGAAGEPGGGRRPPAPRAASPKVTVVAAIAGFLVVFELLAYQLRSGHDPAIGAGPLTAQVQHGSAPAGRSRPPARPGPWSRGRVGPRPAVAQPTQAARHGARPAQRRLARDHHPKQRRWPARVPFDVRRRWVRAGGRL